MHHVQTYVLNQPIAFVISFKIFSNMFAVVTQNVRVVERFQMYIWHLRESAFSPEEDQVISSVDVPLLMSATEA